LLMLDTGANALIASEHYAHALGSKIDTSTAARCTVADGSSSTTIGTAQVEFVLTAEGPKRSYTAHITHDIPAGPYFLFPLSLLDGYTLSAVDEPKLTWHGGGATIDDDPVTIKGRGEPDLPTEDVTTTTG